MKTTLIVDDDAILRSVLVRSVRRHFHVTACDTLTAALALFDGPRVFDAILCDMILDDGTGKDFYDRLRKQSVDQSDRILFLTGYESLPADVPFYEATRGRHLLKPIAADVLIANLAMMAGDGASVAS